MDKATKTNKGKAQEELTNEKTKLEDRIALAEASVQDLETALSTKIAEQFQKVNSKIENAEEKLEKKIALETKDTLDKVKDETKKVNQSNDDIYLKYDSKIKKIKDVCAQYFSKYEKHLINHQTIVKDLER